MKFLTDLGLANYIISDDGRFGNFKTDFLGIPKGKLYPSKSRMMDVLSRTHGFTSVDILVK